MRSNKTNDEVPTMAAIHVVLVDDAEDTSELLAELIQERGHHVRIANDGPHALELLERQLPDVVLLDLGLPVMDGFEVASEMRRRFGYAFRIFALTGYGDAQRRARAEQVGIDGFVTKPLMPDRLATLLEGAPEPQA